MLWREHVIHIRKLLVQTLHDYSAAASSYLAAVLALFVEHSNTLVQVLGFILLIARLVHEVEAVFSKCKKWFSRG
jgi:uncharacterized membrane protein YecN with MAPEG domain